MVRAVHNQQIGFPGQCERTNGMPTLTRYGLKPELNGARIQLIFHSIPAEFFFPDDIVMDLLQLLFGRTVGKAHAKGRNVDLGSDHQLRCTFLLELEVQSSFEGRKRSGRS